MDGIYEKIAEARGKNQELVLCVVTRTAGSTPRAVGAKMLVYPDGTVYATIGGGRVEKKVIADALNALKERKAASVRYDLLRDLQMCCGGSIEIYMEPLMQKNKLYIFGAGHTGVALGRRAADFDFEVSIFDDRSDYIDAVPPGAIHRVHGRYQDILSGLDFDERTYVAIMTYSHVLDREILSYCIKKPNAYIGMIGSRRKVEVTKRLFEEENIGTVEDLERVDMPMGLDIGADGPDEISISILAKLLSVKNKILYE